MSRVLEAGVLRLAWVMCSWLWLGAAQAGAQEPDERRSAAEAHFDRGLELVDAGDYAGALSEFERAHELTGHYAVLYNLGMAHVALDHGPAAVDSLERYLQRGGERVDGARRARVMRELARQKRDVGALQIDTRPPAARVSVDGQPLTDEQRARPVHLRAGTHTLVVEHPEHTPATREVRVPPGVHLQLEVVLERSAAAEPIAAAEAVETGPAPPVVADRRPEAQQRLSSLPGWLSLGAGLVAAGIGVGLFVDSAAHYDRWESTQDQLDRVYAMGGAVGDDTLASQADNDALQRSIQRQEKAAVGLLAGGAVAAAAGGLLLWLAQGEAASVSARVGPGGGGLQLRATF